MRKENLTTEITEYTEGKGRKRENPSFSVFSVASVVIIFLVLSCATAPESPDPFEGETVFLPLEPGASVYLLADVPACRPVLDRIPIREMGEAQAKEIFDRTRSVAAAFYPEGSERRFQAAVWGKYPEFRAALFFIFDKNWKKKRSKTGGSYWYSARDGLSAAVSSSRAFAAGTGPGTAGGPFAAGPGDQADPFTPPPGTEPPESFAEFRRGAALALWFTDPGPLVGRVFAFLGLPLQLPAEQLFVSLFPHAGEGEGNAGEAAARYQARIRIQTPSASQARALLALINLGRSYTPEPGAADGFAALAAALFANPPVQDGRNLNIHTAAMDAGEVALLFWIFWVYSDR